MPLTLCGIDFQAGGLDLLIGSTTEILYGVQLVLEDPWGNEQKSYAGAKREHGPGGFEFRVGQSTRYILFAAGSSLVIPTEIGGTTWIVLDWLEEPAAQPLEIVVIESSRVRDVLPRAAREIAVGDVALVCDWPTVSSWDLIDEILARLDRIIRILEGKVV